MTQRDIKASVGTKSKPENFHKSAACGEDSVLGNVAALQHCYFLGSGLCQRPAQRSVHLTMPMELLMQLFVAKKNRSGWRKKHLMHCHNHAIGLYYFHMHTNTAVFHCSMASCFSELRSPFSDPQLPSVPMPTHQEGCVPQRFDIHVGVSVTALTQHSGMDESAISGAFAEQVYSVASVCGHPARGGEAPGYKGHMCPELHLHTLPCHLQRSSAFPAPIAVPPSGQQQALTHEH